MADRKSGHRSLPFRPYFLQYLKRKEEIEGKLKNLTKRANPEYWRLRKQLIAMENRLKKRWRDINDKHQIFVID